METEFKVPLVGGKPPLVKKRRLPPPPNPLSPATTDSSGGNFVTPEKVTKKRNRKPKQEEVEIDSPLTGGDSSSTPESKFQEEHSDSLMEDSELSKSATLVVPVKKKRATTQKNVISESTANRMNLGVTRKQRHIILKKMIEATKQVIQNDDDERRIME